MTPPHTPEPAEPPPRPLAGWVLVVAAFAVGFANFPLRVVGLGFDHLPGDPFDPRLNNYVLEHGYRYLTGREASFWDAPMFYPTRNVIAWSDAHLGMLPVYSALRATGLTPERAFQGWFLVPFLLNYAAAVWALRRLGFGAAGTAAGAFVFTFGLPLASQLIHAQLYPRFLVPVAVVFAWEFLRAPKTGTFAAVAACVVGQIYLTVYIGYFLLLVLGAGLVVAAARFRRELPWAELVRPGRRAWAARVAVGLAAGLALLPLVAAHLRGVGRAAVAAVRELAPEPRAWATAPPITAFPGVEGVPDRAGVTFTEKQLFPGWVPLLAVAGGLVVILRPGRFGGRGSAVAVAAWSAVPLGLLVTRFGGVWPYEAVAHLPGPGGIRAVGRVVLVLLFPAAVAVAALIDLLVRGARRAGSVPAGGVALLAVAALVAEQWLAPTGGPPWGPFPGRCPVAAVEARQARIAAAVRSHPAPALVYAFPSASADPASDLVLQFEVMRACQDLGVPCVNGWSGYLPGPWDFFPTYRALMAWLTVENAVPPDRLTGLVVIGEPVPDGDPAFEAAMRAQYPPRVVK